MDSTIIVALISGLCTLVGTLGGILASVEDYADMINQRAEWRARIDELEEM